MLFSWDPKKAEYNLKKHGVSFEIAQSIFDDPLHLSMLDQKSKEEERWVTIGKSIHCDMLVVIHTYKIIEAGIEMIRIISARRATRKEQKKYEKGI